MVIVDLSCDVAGRFAAKLFAMAGLEVIRPTGIMPLPTATSVALDRYLDCDKRCAPFSPAQRHQLLADADLVFSSFDRGRWLGLSDDDRGLMASAVHVTTSSFGTTGPYAGWRGGALADWAAGGYLAITGEPDREPLIGPEHLCGYVAGFTAAIAAEAALCVRRQNGRGQLVDISTMEAMLSVHQSTFARVAAGLGRQRTGRFTEVYPLVVLPCRDGHVSVGVVSGDEFDRFVIAIGRPELASDERFADAQGRWNHRDALESEIERFFLHHTCTQVIEALHACELAAAKVVDVHEVLGNPQLRYREFWRSAGLGTMPGNPIPPAHQFAGESGIPAVKRPHWIGHRKQEELPLSGVVVLDFTAYWAGPSATRNLADMGATVIKVERPGSRIDLDDQLEDTAALVNHLYHCKMNRGKFSVCLDLGSTEGRAAIGRLASFADVAMENFRPGVADRLGVGPKALGQINSSLIYVSLSGFGASGPWGGLRSYGPTIEAASSIESRTGYRGGDPLRLGHTLPDGVGGLAGTLAALRGLREREGGGRGGWFDLSQLEAYVALSGEEILDASGQQQVPVRNGNRSAGAMVQGVFPCSGEDEWIALRLADLGDVTSFAKVTRLPDLVPMVLRTDRDDDRIEALVRDYTRAREKHAIAQELQACGLEAVPVFKAQELPCNVHLQERGFLYQVRVGGRDVTLPGTPFRSEPKMAQPSRSAPRVGAHSGMLFGGEGAQTV